MDFADKRITVMGLGRFGGGVGVTKFLVARGADVLVTDLEPAEKLARSVAQLAGLNVRFRLGGHNVSDFTTADLVVVNPAVCPRDNRFLRAAAAAGVPTTSEIRLLVSHLPNRRRVIGVTGTAGKSTTAAMIGHVLAKRHQAWLGGNIGGSLLDKLDQITPDDWIVLELSSFMLEGLRDDRWSPGLAVITNFSPNHLDWHGSAEAYQNAKQAILDYQDPDADAAVIGPDVHNRFTNRVRNLVRREEADVRRNPAIPLLIPGFHNQINATLAADTCAMIGVKRAEAIAALGDFPGLKHRLQFICEHQGVRFYNDSKSTTPEAAVLAIESFPPGTVHAILGGYDKGSDLSRLADVAVHRCRAVYTIGKTGDTIAPGSSMVIRCGTLDRALEVIATNLHEGDVVLLSPGCASWDQFENYEARGEAFVEAVLRFRSEGSPPARPAPRKYP